MANSKIWFKKREPYFKENELETNKNSNYSGQIQLSSYVSKFISFLICLLKWSCDYCPLFFYITI